MSISFRLFRKILLGLIILVSTISLVLSLCIKQHLTHPNAAYVLVIILSILILLSILALARGPLLDSPQPVYTETLSLLAMLPFSLILTLYALTLSLPAYPKSTPTALWTYAILKYLVFSGTALHALYTIGLISTAMLTVCVFDRDVWIRDIDSSPSPFPMGLLVSFMFPCFSRTSTETYSGEQHEEGRVCLPGCNCSAGLKPQLMPETSPELEAVPSMRIVRGLSSRSLVRVPNDIERRMSIPIMFSEV